MNRQRPDLFAPERPIRSDYSQERIYARRRIMTVAVLALVLGGVAYAVVGHRSTDPSEIPTIAGQGDYKQRPADPGGIDIPHQDVRVYDKLEGKGGAQDSEHLLPPPETPHEQPKTADMPVPEAAPPASVQSATATPPVSLLDDKGTTPKQIATTVAPSVAPSGPVGTATPSPPPEDAAPSPQPAPAKTGQQAMTIDKLLKREETPPGAKPAAAPVATAPAHVGAGNALVQLAALPDQAKAQQLMDQLRKKHAAELAGVTLRLVRADLGAKGTYYRIQSQSLPEDKATHICAALKQKNAGCMLVRK